MEEINNYRGTILIDSGAEVSSISKELINENKI